MKVVAKRWAEGWELHVDGVGVTQTRVLQNARRQVADLCESYNGRAVALEEIDIEVLVDDDAVSASAEQVRRLLTKAEDANRSAARESRALAQRLRELGVSVSDTAYLMGVSRGRISQLVK